MLQAMHVSGFCQVPRGVLAIFWFSNKITLILYSLSEYGNRSKQNVIHESHLKTHPLNLKEDCIYLFFF